MKLALCIAALIGPVLLPVSRAAHDAPQERWTRLGHRAVELSHHTIDADQPIEEWFPWAPISVQAAIHGFRDPEFTPRHLYFGYTPDGLEIYVYACSWHPEHSIHESWRLFLRDPRTDAVSPRAIGFSNEYILTEAPRIRLADLDGDGHDELVVRQFMHNGTVHNDDVEVYLEILPDLGLRGVLVHEPRVYDGIYNGGGGYVYSELWVSDLGGLQSRTWREDGWTMLAPVEYGTATLDRDPEKCFEVTGIELTPAAHEGKHPGRVYVGGAIDPHLPFEVYLSACSEPSQVR